MINTVIVENEQPQSEYLTALLDKHFPEVNILKVCTSVPDGIDEIIALKPHLVFLDVELHPYTGFDLLEQTRSINYEVIFTTSYSKYASKAFRFCAIDYVEKPFGISEIKEAISRYKNRAASLSNRKVEALLHNVKQTNVSLQQVGIPVMGGWIFITVSDIIYCQSVNNYTDFILTDNGKIRASNTLKWVEDLLKDHCFFRIHDSFLINLNHIKKYNKGEGGSVELTDKHELDVSRRKKDAFIKTLIDLKIIKNK